MTRKKGIGQEDRMHIQFGCLLQKYEKFKKMPRVISWTYLPMGEYRKPTTASMLKKKGVKSGYPDYVFFIFDKKKLGVDVIFLEMKTEIGKQQQTQKDFQLAFMGATNAEYFLARSVAEAVKILEQEGILITD